MKYLLKLMYFLVYTSITSVHADTDLMPFLSKHSDPIYQDIVIGNSIYPIGSDICDERYELIRPILEAYSHPFSVLDLGAAQGYFSFRIAQDYPKSSCVMVEADNTAYYAHHGSMLNDLCQLNSHLKNVFFLNRRMDLTDLSYLKQNEHFDLIIAFLVVHLMHKNLEEQIKIIDVLLGLGDNLILEVADDVGVVHTAFVEYLSHSTGARYLGEVKRHKDPLSTSKGKLFLFQGKSSFPEKTGASPLKQETFLHLGGEYPQPFIIEENP